MRQKMQEIQIVRLLGSGELRRVSRRVAAVWIQHGIAEAVLPRDIPALLADRTDRDPRIERSRGHGIR